MLQTDALSWQKISFHLNSFLSNAFEPVKVLMFIHPIALLSSVLIVTIGIIKTYQSDRKFIQGVLLRFLFLIITFLIFSLAFERNIFAARYFIFILPTWLYFLTKNIMNLSKERGTTRKSVITLSLTLITVAIVNLSDVIPIPTPNWKNAAEIIKEYKSPVVITSLPNYIEYYFNGIIDQVNTLNSPEDIMKVLNKTETFHSLWIVDTQLNWQNYSDQFNATMKKVGYVAEDHSLFSNNTDSIILIRFHPFNEM
jgi:hypothetical protein